MCDLIQNDWLGEVGGTPQIKHHEMRSVPHMLVTPAPSNKHQQTIPPILLATGGSASTAKRAAKKPCAAVTAKRLKSPAARRMAAARFLRAGGSTICGPSNKEI